MRENDTGEKKISALPGKKRIIAVLLLLLAAGVVTAATWGFYTAQSNHKTNPFFSDDGDRYRYKRAERLRVYNGRRRNGHNKKGHNREP